MNSEITITLKTDDLKKLHFILKNYNLCDAQVDEKCELDDDWLYGLDMSANPKDVCWHGFNCHYSKTSEHPNGRVCIKNHSGKSLCVHEQNAIDEGMTDAESMNMCPDNRSCSSNHFGYSRCTHSKCWRKNSGCSRIHVKYPKKYKEILKAKRFK